MKTNNVTPSPFEQEGGTNEGKTTNIDATQKLIDNVSAKTKTYNPE